MLDYKNYESMFTYSKIQEKVNLTKNIHSINIKNFNDDFLTMYIAIKQIERIIKTQDKTILLPKIITNDKFRQYSAIVDFDLSFQFECFLDSIVISNDFTINKNNIDQSKLLLPVFNIDKNTNWHGWHIFSKNICYCLKKFI